jgi:hypothetical protein
MSPFRPDPLRPLVARTARRRPAVRRAPSGGAALAAVALLCGCAQPPPTRFHTLVPDWQSGAAAPRASAPGWWLGELRVPVQVDRPQLVLLAGDGTLAVVERERWLAPLGDELRAALEQDLQRALGPADAGPAAERWEIDVEVRRFESALGAEARLEAQWALGRGGAPGEGPVCRLRVAQPAPGDVPALAAAHRAALARLAEAIAASLRSRAGGGAACAGGEVQA